MINSETELKQLSSLKTLMMLAVVLYHSCLTVSGNGWGGVQLSRHNLILTYFASWLNTFHIQVFTFVSGYLFYYGRYKKEKYQKPKQDITRRVMRLIVPYVLVSALWAIPARLMAYGFSWSIIIKDFVLAIQPAQLWFLPMLFIIYLIGYFGSDLMVRNEKVTLIVLYCIYVTSIFVKRFVPIGIFQIGNALQFLIYYFLGFMYAKGKMRTKVHPLILLLISILSSYFYTRLMDRNDIDIFLQIVLPVICTIGILTFSSFSRQRHFDKLQSRTLWKVLTQNSMGVFLFHQQIIYLTMRELDFRTLPDIIYVFLHFSIALLTGLFISYGLKKAKIGRIILGEGR